MNKIVFIFLLLIIPATAYADIYSDRSTFKIAIDAGHSKNNPGAKSAKGVGEYFFNKKIAKLISEELKNRGFTNLIYINEEGNDITLSERVKMANGTKARLLISIHHDSVQPFYLSEWSYNNKKLKYSDKFNGYSLFYSEKNVKSLQSFRVATLIGKELLNMGFSPTNHHAEKIDGENRELVDRGKGIYRFDNLVMLKSSMMPAVLIECGIIMNRMEEIFLSNPVYQKALVLSICQAVERQCAEESIYFKKSNN